MEAPLFDLKNISKYFTEVIANKDVSFSIRKGEVLALLGENGAGKSTIMKILYGLYKADEGKLYKEGKEIKINSPKDAIQLGISMIQQHFSLVPAHTVLENILLGNVHGILRYDEYEKKVETIAKQYGFIIPLKAKVSELAVGVLQKVEIIKALYLESSLLIMDEPTAVLTPQEADRLMEFVKEYTKKGNCVIFITHKLKEVMQVADRILVMRNGMLCGDLNASDTDEKELSKMMIGEDIILPKLQDSKSTTISNEKLILNHVSIDRKGQTSLLKDVSFAIHAGEIFGIAGVSGNGQEEVCEAICGACQISKGEIYLNGVSISSLSMRERIHMGIGYVPVDRHRDAMVMNMTLAENMMLRSSFDKKWIRHGLIEKKKLADHTKKAINAFQIKAPGPEADAKGLSGGNQQKVVLAREVEHGSELLLLNQPTRGLDLGAIHNIHTTILKERKKGKSILLVSTEISEIFALCDRIAVIYKGSLMGIYKPHELTTEKIGLLMAGFRIESEV